MEEHHLSVNAAMHAPCSLFCTSARPLLELAPKSPLLLLYGRRRTAAGPLSLGRHGHKDSISHEATISPSPLAVSQRIASTWTEYVND